MKVKRKIAFFVPDTVQVLDLCGPVQVFYEANCYGAEYELLYFSLGRQTIGAGGLPLLVKSSFQEIDLQAGDFIFLPGAEMSYLQSGRLKGQKKFFDWLVTNYEAGVTICSVCTGAFILAETGLLDGRICTTHWKRIPELKMAFPKLQLVNDILFTKEDRIYTSAGITSGIDLALAIVEEHQGAVFANRTSRHLLVYYRRSGTHAQQSAYLNYRNHLYSGVHAVQDWLVENLDKKRTIAELSTLANMSERNLARLFKKATGVTINQYTKALKLEKLKTLKKNADLKNDALASQVGYKNARQLRRIQKNPS